MLYDTRWDQNKETTPVKHDPLSLASLIAWLETMPPERKYCWFGKEPCLIEQFANYHCLSKHELYSIFDINGRNLYDRLTTKSAIAESLPHTFGAALTRARAIMEQGT